MEELNAFLKPQRADLRELETEVAFLELLVGKLRVTTLFCALWIDVDVNASMAVLWVSARAAASKCSEQWRN